MVIQFSDRFCVYISLLALLFHSLALGKLDDREEAAILIRGSPDAEVPADLPSLAVLAVGADPEPLSFDVSPVSFDRAASTEQSPSPVGCRERPRFDTWLSADLTKVMGKRDRDRLLEVKVELPPSSIVTEVALEVYVVVDAKLNSVLANALEWFLYSGGRRHFVGDIAVSWGLDESFRGKFCPVISTRHGGQRSVQVPVPLVTPQTMLWALGLNDDFGQWEDANLILRVSVDHPPEDHHSLNLQFAVHDDPSFRSAIKDQWVVSRGHGSVFDPPQTHYSVGKVLLVGAVLGFWALSCVAGCCFMTGRYFLWKKYGWRGLTKNPNKFL